MGFSSSTFMKEMKVKPKKRKKKLKQLVNIAIKL
jgi:hypothetical protein